MRNILIAFGIVDLLLLGAIGYVYNNKDTIFGAGIKISELTSSSGITNDDLIPIVDDPNGTPVTKRVTFASVTSSITQLSLSKLSTTNASSSFFAISGLNSCDSIDSDANGNLMCGTDSGGTVDTDTLAIVTNRGSFATSSVSFYGGLTTANLTATGTTSLQNVTTTGLASSLLLSCTAKTDANGNFYCGTDNTGGGSSAVGWSDDGTFVYLTTSTRIAKAFSDVIVRNLSVTSTLTSIAASGTAALTNMSFASATGTRLALAGNLYVTGTISVAGNTSTFTNDITARMFDVEHVHTTHTEVRSYAQFNDTVDPGASTGMVRLFSLSSNGYSMLEQSDGALNCPITVSQDNVMLVKNTSGYNLTQGRPVYITGEVGAIPTVSGAQANATTTLPSVGVVLCSSSSATAIPNNNFGYIMKLGLIEDFNTSAYAAGDILYVSASASGTLTNVRPASPNYAQRVGSVLSSGIGNGVLFITIAPFVGGLESGTTETYWRGRNISWNSATGTNATTTALGVTGLASLSNVTSTNIVTNSATIGAATITSGAINGTTIGASVPSTGAFTTITLGTLDLLPVANNDGTDLGSDALSLSNIYASGTIYGNRFLGGLGAVGTPTFTFSDDPNTGIYSGGADTLNIAIGGSARYSMNASTAAFFIGSSLTIGGGASQLIPGSNNLLNIGTGALSMANIYASGTLSVGAVTSSGPISPYTNNAYDIGSMDKSWRNIYASGSILGGNVTSSNGLAIRGVLNCSGKLITDANGNVFCGTDATGGGGGANSPFTDLGTGTVYLVTSTNAVVLWDGLTAVTITATSTANDAIKTSGGISASGTLYVGGVTTTGPISPYTGGKFDLGTASSSWRNIYASGTIVALSVTTTGNIYPKVANTASIGVLAFPYLSAFIRNLAVRNITDIGGQTASSTVVLSGRSGEILTSVTPRPTSTQLTINGFPRTLAAFNASTTNCIYWGSEYVRDAWNGLQVAPKITSLNASGTGAFVWELWAESVVSGTKMGVFTGSPAYATTTATSQAYTNIESTFSLLTVGSATTGTTMQFMLCRDAEQAGDTLGGEAFANSLKIEMGLASYSD